MLAEAVEWTGTIFLIIGAIMFARFRTSEQHLRGFYAYIIGCMFYLMLALMLHMWGMLLSQSVFLVINIMGIRNCRRELNGA